jgi:hypothetical protein
MSRPRLSEIDKKEKRLTVRFKPDEMEELRPLRIGSVRSSGSSL